MSGEPRWNSATGGLVAPNHGSLLPGHSHGGGITVTSRRCFRIDYFRKIKRNKRPRKTFWFDMKNTINGERSTLEWKVKFLRISPVLLEPCQLPAMLPVTTTTDAMFGHVSHCAGDGEPQGAGYQSYSALNEQERSWSIKLIICSWPMSLLCEHEWRKDVCVGNWVDVAVQVRNI